MAEQAEHVNIAFRNSIHTGMNSLTYQGGPGIVKIISFQVWSRIVTRLMDATLLLLWVQASVDHLGGRGERVITTDKSIARPKGE